MSSAERGLVSQSRVRRPHAILGRPRTQPTPTSLYRLLSKLNTHPPPYTSKDRKEQREKPSFLTSSRRNKQSRGAAAMAKVHPNAVAPEPATTTTCPAEAEVLTVWRKSLLFNCDGFTVFDARGDLAFRVDCYASGSRRAEVVLMDVAGKPLLTVRRKRLISLVAEHWVIYDGDAAEDEAKPLLSVRRHVSLRASSKTLAYVTPLGSAASQSSAAYVVEGSYGRRACAVRDAQGDAVAEVRRKESVGDDVFRLVADPRLGAPLAMGLVIALDEMFAGRAGSLLRRTWSAA